MSTATRSASAGTISFDAHQMAEDMAALGWSKSDLADKAGVNDMTVIRFLRGERQTSKTAKKLAKALRRSIRRYLISSRRVA